MTFLDVKLSLGDRYKTKGLIDFEAYRKITAIGLPLSPTSYHPRSVHQSWPKSMLARTRALTSSKPRANELCAELAARWRSHGVVATTQPHPKTILTLSLQPYCFNSRFVMPYNCWWPALKVSRAIQLANRIVSETLPRFPIKFSFSWKLSGRHLANVVRSYNDFECDSDDRLGIFAIGGVRGW